ncbi:MAG: hypothetical protein IIA72_22360 [Proteobacteria bacterium]|nr:hypothetical protein [Pseudomonadota bacterium]
MSVYDALDGSHPHASQSRSIHERPQAVDRRQEFGHRDGDPLQFRTQARQPLDADRARHASPTLAAPLKSKTAKATDRLLRAIFRRLPQLARRSITFDNGSEFARHQNLAQTLDMKT